MFHAHLQQLFSMVFHEHIWSEFASTWPVKTVFVFGSHRTVILPLVVGITPAHDPLWESQKRQQVLPEKVLFAPQVRTPCLIINAMDDPLTVPTSLGLPTVSTLDGLKELVFISSCFCHSCSRSCQFFTAMKTGKRQISWKRSWNHHDFVADSIDDPENWLVFYECFQLVLAQERFWQNARRVRPGILIRVRVVSGNFAQATNTLCFWEFHGFGLCNSKKQSGRVRIPWGQLYTFQAADILTFVRNLQCIIMYIYIHIHMIIWVIWIQLKPFHGSSLNIHSIGSLWPGQLLFRTRKWSDFCWDDSTVNMWYLGKRR